MLSLLNSLYLILCIEIFYNRSIRLLKKRNKEDFIVYVVFVTFAFFLGLFIFHLFFQASPGNVSPCPVVLRSVCEISQNAAQAHGTNIDFEQLDQTPNATPLPLSPPQCPRCRRLLPIIIENHDENQNEKSNENEQRKDNECVWTD